MIAHFLSKGHTLEEMTNLSKTELLFYLAAWEVEAGYVKAAMEEVNGSIGK